jgi:membrane-bound metal-dependent hydrolase YbcI (DUF457 family)
MPSSWTHAATAVATAALLAPREIPRSTWAAVAATVVVLDVDALPRIWGGEDVGWLGGHRAFTHSLTFAALSALVLVTLLGRGTALRLQLWLALAAAVATHGILDALVTYGGGVQFLAPFNEIRYQSPWQPLGDGIVRDTLAFAAAFIGARWLIQRRRSSLPEAFGPRSRQPDESHGR